MKSISAARMLLVLLVSIPGLTSAYSQQNNNEKKQDNNEKKQDKIAKVQRLIDSKNYVFMAQSALPLSGRVIQLTSGYDLRVSGDTVKSELPYFGRAYVAPLDPTEGGIHFTSTDVAYNSSQSKKGNWQITIAPKNTQDTRQISLSVTEDGYATLQVDSNNRQSISFNGYIAAGGSN